MKLKKTKSPVVVTNAKYESKIELRGEDAKDFYHVVGNALNWTSEWMNNRKIHFLLTTKDDYCPTSKYTFLHLYGATVEIMHYVPDNPAESPQAIHTGVNIIGPRIARYKAKSKLEKISGMELGRKMKPRSYVKRLSGYYLKELDRGLKGVSKKARIEALCAYKIGLNFSFNSSYPNKFDFDKAELSKVDETFRGFYDFGAYVGKQFSSLDTDTAREFLLAEVEKRKQKFSKKSWLEQYYNLFSLQGLFGKGK